MMTNVERYTFGDEAYFPTELNSDDLESFFPINDEYCDINVDLFNENALETFGPDLDDGSFENLFLSSLITESTDKVNIQNEEDTCATSSPHSDQVVADFKLNIDSNSEDTEVESLLLPSKSPSDHHAVGNALTEKGNCFTGVVIKEEIKEDAYHFMPNVSEQFNFSDDQKYPFDTTSLYNGNIAELVKTRKRTCNNSKSANTTSEKGKTKNRSLHKKERTNKNSTVKNVTVVPALSSRKFVSSGSNSQLFSCGVLNVKQESHETSIFCNSIKCNDDKDSESIQFITDKASTEKQDIPVKCEVLSSLPKNKVKKQKKRSENASDTIVLLKENKNTDPVSLSNANISKSSSDISDCQQLNQSSTESKTNLIPPHLDSSDSESETEISNVTSACTNISDNDKTSTDVCTSLMENSCKVESPSLFKLRISRCANQFKSYVIPAEPIPVPPPQSRLEDVNKHKITDDVASYKEISPVRNVKVEKPLDANKNKHLSDKRQNKELKNNKKKRKRSDKYKDSPKSNLTNQIECKSNDASRMQTIFDICDTSFDSAITNTPLLSVKKEVTMTKTFDRTVNATNFLKNEIPGCQQFDANQQRVCFEKQSKYDMSKCVFPKARKKLKKNDVFQYDSLFNDKSQCDSSKAIVSRNCDSNKAKTVETVPIKKIKKELVDTHEYSEFEMHQSVDVPLDGLSNICTFNDKTLGIFDYKTSEKSSPLLSSGNFDTKQNITLHKKTGINKVVNKSQEHSNPKLTNSNSVLKSAKINLNLGNKPTERNSPVLELSISPIGSPYMLEENFDTFPSPSDFVLPEESDKKFDPVPFMKSTDSQSSLTSSQGTIVNTENYFQESEASKVSNVCEPEKNLLDVNLLNSPPFSNFDENLTNDSKSLSPPMNAELESFEAEISNQSTYRKIESIQLQKNCMPPQVFVCESMSIAHVPKNSLPANSAKCTDSKAVGLPQGKESTDEANQSSNFLIATMHNSFHFQIIKKGTEEPLSQTTNDNKETTTSRDNSSECSSIEPKKLPVPKSNARQYRSRKRSRTSSSSSDSFYDHKTSKRVKKYRISRRKELLESSRKRSYSRHHKSSSRSSFSESRSSHYSHSSTTTYDERSRSPAESFRKSERRRHRSSRSRSRRRRKHRSPSRSYSRSRSPRSRRGSSRDRARSVSSSRRNVAEEQEKQTDERRVVYVGQIPDGFSTSDLRERFDRFGRIEDINIHRKNSKRNNNFGFVTFKHTEDACEAIARGNDPPMKPRFDISFGGRRLFCRQRYSDLDKEKELMEDNDYYYPPPKADDFDSLLNAELRRTGLHDKKY